jgi:hypothetical protein
MEAWKREMEHLTDGTQAGADRGRRSHRPATPDDAGAGARDASAASAIAPAAARSATPARVSMLRYSPALIVVLVMVADAMRYADTDLWGHLRFGQAMLAQRRLIINDPYSYSAAGHLWRNHEWLSEIVMAALYNALGVHGLKLMKLLASAATILLLASAVAETGAAASLQLGVLTLSAVALAPQMQFRPQLFTFVMLAALMAILARDNYRGRAPLWLAIPMLALWANLHGGFIVGIAALATYAGFATADGLAQGRGASRGPRLFAVTLAATLATLITPYGIEAWYAVANALRDPFTRLAVADWQPLHAAMIEAWRESPAGLLYGGCVLAMLAALIYSTVRAPRAGDLPILAIAFLMAVAALVSARNMALFVITAAAPLARHLGAVARARRSIEAEHHVPERAAINPAVALVIAAVLALYSGLFTNRLPETIPYPAGAIAFMAQHGLSGNLLGDFNWGEYLIWHTAPQSRVFIDGRYDTVYPLPVIRDYLNFYFDRPGGSQVLEEYPHDFVLVPPASGAARVTARSPGWKLVYRDPAALLFARAASSAASPGDTVRGGTPSGLFP